MPKIMLNGKEYGATLGETEGTAYAGNKGKALSDKIGNTDIKGIGDGTITGAIKKLDENKFDSSVLYKKADKSLYGDTTINVGRRSGSTVGSYSCAEGSSNIASGNSSHAEGYATTASGNSSHAEGNTTTASGLCSHAEGNNTVASGAISHAEGANVTASGSYSHAEGCGTIAKGSYSHVQGKYNVEDTTNKYAHIIGGGTSAARKNIHTVDWSGNASYSGDVTAHDSSGNAASILNHSHPVLSNVEKILFKVGSGVIPSISVNSNNQIAFNKAIVPSNGYYLPLGSFSYPFGNCYLQDELLFIAEGMGYTGISFYSSLSIPYGTASSIIGKGLSIGSTSLLLRLNAKSVYINSDYGVRLSGHLYEYSDEKIKVFTDDVEIDSNDLVKLFDIIKIRSFKYRYLSNEISIGLNAEEFEEDMKACDLNPTKYGILNIDYGTFISRGDGPEDDKFYFKFGSVSYEKLATLSILKIQAMEKEHKDRLDSIEKRLAELEKNNQ